MMQIHAVADTVTVLDAPSLSLLRILSISDVFPGSKTLISAICVDADAFLVSLRSVVALVTLLNEYYFRSRLLQVLA